MWMQWEHILKTQCINCINGISKRSYYYYLYNFWQDVWESFSLFFYPQTGVYPISQKVNKLQPIIYSRLMLILSAFPWPSAIALGLRLIPIQPLDQFLSKQAVFVLSFTVSNKLGLELIKSPFQEKIKFGVWGVTTFKLHNCPYLLSAFCLGYDLWDMPGLMAPTEVRPSRPIKFSPLFLTPPWFLNFYFFLLQMQLTLQVA